MEVLTTSSLSSCPGFSTPVLKRCVGGQSWCTRSCGRSCGGDTATLVGFPLLLPRCRPKVTRDHQSANRSFLFSSLFSSLSGDSSTTDLTMAACSWTAASCKYYGRRCLRIFMASSSSSSPMPREDGPEEEEEEGKNGYEVERALGMDGGIPSSSEEFLRRVSSRAYDMRRHLLQTIDSSSYEVLDHNPWREDSKPVFVLTQGNNQLCTMKTRQSRSEVERELGLLFARRTKWDKIVDNKVKHARSSTKFNMLVEDIREGVLVTKLHFRGARIWVAIMEDLLAKGMDRAENALLSGCSAGGLTSIIHCDNFRSLFPVSARVKCLSDAGFFINAKDITGAEHIKAYFDDVVTTHGSAKNLPSSCTTRLPPGMIRNILAPGAADPHGIWNDCKLDMKQCSSSQLHLVQGFRLQFLHALAEIGSSSSRGLFISSCYSHCQSEMQETWFRFDSPILGNKTIAEAVGDWFYMRSSFQKIDCPFPCNTSCKNNTFEANLGA